MRNQENYLGEEKRVISLVGRIPIISSTEDLGK